MSLRRALLPLVLTVTLAGSFATITAATGHAAGPAVPRRARVTILNFAFAPVTLKITAGTTVVWTNKDSVAHTVTGARWSSGALNQGQSYAYTFKKPGSYTYHCAFHPSMIAHVVVSAPAHAPRTIAPPSSGY